MNERRGQPAPSLSIRSEASSLAFRRRFQGLVALRTPTNAPKVWLCLAALEWRDGPYHGYRASPNFKRATASR